MARKKRTSAKLNRNQRKRIKRIAEEQGQRAAQRAKKNMVSRNQSRVDRLQSSNDVERDATGIDYLPGDLPSTPLSSIEEIPYLGTDNLDSYEDFLYNTLAPQFNDYALSFAGEQAGGVDNLFDLAQGYLDRESAFTNRRVEKSLADNDKVLAARGLFNSGAALESSGEIINDIRGEEQERAFDLASRDQNIQMQTALNNQQQGLANAQYVSNTYKSLIENELRRNDSLNQADFDNMLAATDLFFRQSPLNTGYNASSTIANNTLNFGNQQAAGTAQNYTRVSPNLQAVPGSTPQAPTLDRTGSIIANAEAIASNAIGKANNNAIETGNTANTVGALLQNAPSIIAGLGSIFGGGTTPKTPTVIGSSRT